MKEYISDTSIMRSQIYKRKSMLTGSEDIEKKLTVAGHNLS